MNQEEKLELACKKHIEKFGVIPQLIVSMEEAGELIQAVSKYYRFREGYLFGDQWDEMRIENLLIGEIVDMEIMIKQLKEILSSIRLFNGRYETIRDFKINRAWERVEE